MLSCRPEIAGAKRKTSRKQHFSGHVSPRLNVSWFRAQAAFKCTMLTSEKPTRSPGPQDGGLATWAEATFEEKCTYVVKDQPLEDESENGSKTRAERTLPRNLALKRCHSSGEVCTPRVSTFYEGTGSGSRPHCFSLFFFLMPQQPEGKRRLWIRSQPSLYGAKECTGGLFCRMRASRQHPSIHVFIPQTGRT